MNSNTFKALGFSVYVSNTTDISNGTLCFKDTDFNSSTIPAVFNITCSVHGQYVIYYNERLQGVSYPDEYSTFAWNALCEVEVYGMYFPFNYARLLTLLVLEFQLIWLIILQLTICVFVLATSAECGMIIL